MVAKESSASQDTSDPVAYRGELFRSKKFFSLGTHRASNPEQTVETIRPFLERAGVTRIADITGLDTVGVPTTLAIRPNAQTMACSSGKGLTLEQAFASGAMEAFELHAAETAELASVHAPYSEMAKHFPMPEIESLPLSGNSFFRPDWPLHWYLGWDLISQQEVPVPLATVGMSRSAALVSSVGAFNVSSNGLGAGNTFLEAIAAGLYEVIERDAVACCYSAAQFRGDLFPVIGENELRKHSLVASVLDKCQAADVKVVVQDFSIDTDVPTYDAIVYDQLDQGIGVVKGSGSHLDAEVALLRSITEALQGRLNFIAGSRDDIFRSAFVRFRSERQRIVHAIEADASQRPLGQVVDSSASDCFEADIHDLLRRLTRAGLKQVIVADLTPQGFPVHVVRIIVPGLEGYLHHGYRPGPRAMGMSGGGEG